MSTEYGSGGPDRRRDEPTEPTGPTIRDRRRIDPQTGEVRPGAERAAGGPPGPGHALPGAGAGAGSAGSGAAGSSAASDAEVVGLQAELAERTADLQRVQAEYLNYRRRVERDRDAVRDLATANVVLLLLPVLDDIGRAREHGELVGGFRQVADALDQALAKLGVVAFGEPGEAFDPTRHEALMHAYSEDVTETTCTQVFAPGYQFGDRILRPARVAVADPVDGPAQAPTDPAPGSAGAATEPPSAEPTAEAADGPPRVD